MANLYDATPDPARTWLGYATYTVGGGAANGSISPIAPATLTGPTGAAVDVVNTTAARGANELYKLTYPAATTGSTFSATGAGRIKASIELSGAFKFQIHETRGIKPITIVNPVVDIDGAVGTLRASGTKATAAVTPFDRTDTQFTLDLSNANVIQRPDGSRTIAGIVPVNTASTVLAGFPPTSRLFGTMALTVGVDEVIAATPLPAGTPGPAGPAGPAGKDATFRVVRLAKAAFATKAEVHVRLIDRATKKTIARGTVEKKTLRLSVPAGTKLKGTYTLQRDGQEGLGQAHRHDHDQVARTSKGQALYLLSDRCLDLRDTCR